MILSACKLRPEGVAKGVSAPRLPPQAPRTTPPRAGLSQSGTDQTEGLAPSAVNSNRVEKHPILAAPGRRHRGEAPPKQRTKRSVYSSRSAPAGGHEAMHIVLQRKSRPLLVAEFHRPAASQKTRCSGAPENAQRLFRSAYRKSPLVAGWQTTGRARSARAAPAKAVA